MNLPPRRVQASLVLAALLLPLCTFAAPLRLQFVRSNSSVTDIPTLSAESLRERTLYGLRQATAQQEDKAVLLPEGALEGPEVLVGARLGRSGMKYRLVYTLQTAQLPRLSRQLAYEFNNPQLTDRGVTVMAGELIAEAVKLEAERKSQAASQPVATAPEAAAPEEAAPPQSSNTPPPTVARREPERETRVELSEYSRPKPRHTLDLGLASGLNSPSGMLGAEVEYRPHENVGVLLGAGVGTWGYRFTPAARLYPLGISGASLFLEAGMSLNMGNQDNVELDGQARVLKQFLTPVATVATGTRFNLDRIYFSPRVGWAFRLRQDNYEPADGRVLSELEHGLIGLFQHGGFLLNLTAGVTFL